MKKLIFIIIALLSIATVFALSTTNVGNLNFKGWINGSIGWGNLTNIPPNIYNEYNLGNFTVNYDLRFSTNLTKMGNINMSNGNLTMNDNSICLNSNCSKYITHNGSDVIIQG